MNGGSSGNQPINFNVVVYVSLSLSLSPFIFSFLICPLSLPPPPLPFLMTIIGETQQARSDQTCPSPPTLAELFLLTHGSGYTSSLSSLPFLLLLFYLLYYNLKNIYSEYIFSFLIFILRALLTSVHSLPALMMGNHYYLASSLSPLPLLLSFRFPSPFPTLLLVSFILYLHINQNLVRVHLTRHRRHSVSKKTTVLSLLISPPFSSPDYLLLFSFIFSFFLLI